MSTSKLQIPKNASKVVRSTKLKQDGSNYRLWRFAMQNHAVAHKLQFAFKVHVHALPKERRGVFDEDEYDVLEDPIAVNKIMKIRTSEFEEIKKSMREEEKEARAVLYSDLLLAIGYIVVRSSYATV